MAREFRLPDIGEGLTEAEIIQWLVSIGDTVMADQPVVEVETDKAVVEIPSPYAGVVVALGGTEGEVIEVGSILLVIAEPGESPGRPPEVDGSPAVVVEPEPESVPPPPPVPEPSPAPIVGSISEEAELIESPPIETLQPPSKVKALPVVRKLARDNGVDIETVVGTGPDGRITRSDVEAAIRGAISRPPIAPEPVTPARSTTPGAGEERVPMSRLRRTISAHMSRSWAEIPHVTTFDEVNATRLLEVRTALGVRHQVKFPLEALVIRAVIPALDAFPEFNASIDGDDLVLHRARDIGIAVDTDDGLMVAVVRGAEAKGALALAEEIRRLGEGARSRSLSPGELTGQTFTVSNIGAVGGGHGTPIVPYGTTAILSIGRATPRPAVINGELGVAPLMPLSLSYDHRVIDGAQGRRFMTLLIENLEEPALFLAG